MESVGLEALSTPTTEVDSLLQFVWINSFLQKFKIAQIRSDLLNNVIMPLERPRDVLQSMDILRNLISPEWKGEWTDAMESCAEAAKHFRLLLNHGTMDYKAGSSIAVMTTYGEWMNVIDKLSKSSYWSIPKIYKEELDDRDELDDLHSYIVINPKSEIIYSDNDVKSEKQHLFNQEHVNSYLDVNVEKGINEDDNTEIYCIDFTVDQEEFDNPEPKYQPSKRQFFRPNEKENGKLSSMKCDNEDAINSSTFIHYTDDNDYFLPSTLKDNNTDSTIKSPSKRRGDVRNKKKMNNGKSYFDCSLCQFKSKTRSHLIRHLMVHTGQKHFECNICDYKCTQKCSLTRHIKTHTGEKNFKCTFCEHKFITKANLMAHEKTHTGERDLQCKFCDFRCIQKSNLKDHIKTHTGEKNFKCDYCDYECIQKSNLTCHIKIHTGEKNFKCDRCDYRCITKRDLMKHSKVHTRKDLNKR